MKLYLVFILPAGWREHKKIGSKIIQAKIFSIEQKITPIMNYMVGVLTPKDYYFLAALSAFSS